MSETEMPEKIWAWMGMQENGSWDAEAYENISEQYRLKSTVDAEREADSKVIKELGNILVGRRQHPTPGQSIRAFKEKQR